MATVTLWLIVSMLLLNAASWAVPTFMSSHAGRGFAFALTAKLTGELNIDVRLLPLWQRIGATALSSVPLMVLAAGLRHLREVFRCYGRGAYFSAAAAAHLATLGKCVALWALLELVCEPLLSVWLTLRASAGHHIVTVGIGSPQIVALFLAASIAVIARILSKASELDAEHRLFV